MRFLDSIEHLVEDFTNRTFWLEPIEMCPGTAPMIAVLGRLNNALSEFGMGFDNNWLDEFQQVVYHTVLGQYNNLDQRKGHLDPDCYAAEVIRAAHSQVRFPSMMRDMWGGLANKTKQYAGVDNPNFVLCLWDYDFHFPEHNQIVTELQHFMPPCMECFLVADIPEVHRLVPEVRKARYQFHLITSENMLRLFNEVDEASAYPSKMYHEEDLMHWAGAIGEAPADPPPPPLNKKEKEVHQQGVLVLREKLNKLGIGSKKPDAPEATEPVAVPSVSDNDPNWLAKAKGTLSKVQNKKGRWLDE